MSLDKERIEFEQQENALAEERYKSFDRDAAYSSKELMKKYHDIDLTKDDVNKKIEDIVATFQEGIDYDYPFAGAKKKNLLKPGTEKVTLKFNMMMKFELDNEVYSIMPVRMKEKGVVAVKCYLVHRLTGTVIGEGRGAYEIGEKRNNLINHAMKMAQVRAQKDAVLRTFALSDRFVQDAELIEKGDEDLKPVDTTIQVTPDGKTTEIS